MSDLIYNSTEKTNALFRRRKGGGGKEEEIKFLKLNLTNLNDNQYHDKHF